MLKRLFAWGAVLVLALCFAAAAVAQILPVFHAATTALANSLVVKPSPGYLYNANCTAITGGAAGFCAVINATAAPANGAAITPLDFCYFAAGAGGCSLSHSIAPISYTTGIVVVVTTAASPFIFTSGTDTAAIGSDFN